MNLLDKFIQQIALITARDPSDIQIKSNEILIGSDRLPLINVFFSENIIFDNPNYILDYLTQHELKPGDNLTLQCKHDKTIYYTVIRLQIKNQNIQQGCYETLNNSGDRNGIIFTGSFFGSINQPEFTSFQEILFSICLLSSIHPLQEISWAGIFESLGSFAIFTGENIPYSSLADCGIFPASIEPFTFSWANEIPQDFRNRKDDVPQEAEKAYIAALSTSISPGVAFIQLYRAFEILFAVGLKEKIKNSAVTEVLKVMRDFKSLAELDMLSNLLNKPSISFYSFTPTDFITLFGSHKPEGTYQKITDFLYPKSSCFPAKFPNNLVATIIYYIRCSLIHSKLGEKEPFLLEPFSDKKINALCNLVEDMRNIIKSLVY